MTTVEEGQTIIATSPADIALTDAPFTWRTLQAIARTEFVPAGLRGKPEAILACVLTGRELGLGPMESLRMIDMIDGKPSPSSEWMLARVFDAGHLIYPEVQTDQICTVVGKRLAGTTLLAEMKFTFTIDMAKRAGLAGKNNWKSYPEAMLYWRAVAQVCRQLFPDLLHGLKYLPEELGSEEWTMPPPVSGNGAAREVVPLEVIDAIELAEPAEPLDLAADAVVSQDETVWADLFNLVAEDPKDEDTMKVLEGRLRSLYELMETAGLWRPASDGTDSLHLALKKYAQVDHVSEMRKDALVGFCHLSWESARTALAKLGP